MAVVVWFTYFEQLLLEEPPLPPTLARVKPSFSKFDEKVIKGGATVGSGHKA